MTIQEILNIELSRLKTDIATRSEQAGQRATGKTIASVSVENVSESGGQLLGNDYIGVLATGRKGGKVPYDFIDILKRWATAKGITFSDERQFNTWAYFVKKKIQKEGTVLYRSGVTKDIFDTPIADFQTRLSEKIAGHYQEQITNEIFKF